MRRAALLFNPRAGQGSGARTLARIHLALGAEFELEAIPTRSPGHCRELARRAVAERLDAVFALGGDGTLRVVAGELVGTDVALGPLPGGTTNVVAGALGLPSAPLAAARALAVAERRRLDVGRAGEGVFLMQISGGLDARVLAAVDPRAKQRFGKLAVAWTGLAVWSSYRFPEYVLEADGERLSATGFAVANLAEYAGRFEIVPGARADDRQLELLTFSGRRRREALGFALALARGRHTRRRDVAVRRVERVRVMAPAPLVLQGDGDAFDAAPPFEIRLSSRQLWVLAPPPPGGARDRRPLR